jgi:hypothetical protein
MSTKMSTKALIDEVLRLRANQARRDAFVRQHCYKCAENGFTVKCDELNGNCPKCGLQFYQMPLEENQLAELDRKLPKLDALEAAILYGCALCGGEGRNGGCVLCGGRPAAASVAAVTASAKKRWWWF